MKKLQFPSNLLLENNRYGNQFMVIYINEPSSEVEAYKETDNKTVFNTDGNKIDTPTKGNRTIGLTEGGSIRPTINNIVKYAIFLPIPMSLKTNYGVSYKDFNLTDEVIGVGSSVLGQIGTTISKAVSGFAGKRKADVLTSAGSFLGGVVPVILKAGLMYNGMAINPHTELLFEGIKFRDFDFSYKLIARSKKESDSIKELVNLFRFHMHPGLAAESLLFKFPSDFDIAFYYIDKSGKAVENTYLSFIMTSVLKDVSVNYSGNNNYVSFKDTYAPVDIDLTLKFQEKQILTKEIINKIQQSMETKVEVTEDLGGNT